MFMEEAIRMAEMNAATGFTEGGPFGAVIVRDGEIIGRGKNNVLKNNDPTAHAKICAIRDACSRIGSYDLTGCDLYTTCMPCPMCLAAIIWSNIVNVYYGNTEEDADAIGFRDDDIYEELSNIHNNLKSSMINLISRDRDKTLGTFRKFSELKGKIIY